MEAAAQHSKRASNSLVRHAAPVFMKRDLGGEVGIPTAFAISDGWEGRLVLWTKGRQADPKELIPF
jgi:hypothetical protein